MQFNQILKVRACLTDVTFTGRLPHPDVLQHAQVDVISNETCNRPDWYGGLVTDRMLCAGKSEGGRDSCQVKYFATKSSV